MIYPLSFTTTELNRIEIIQESLLSFEANVKNINLKDYDLYISLDPVPNNVGLDEIVEFLKTKFKQVTVVKSTTPNHVQALKNVWNMANSEVIFHLEMDWRWTTPIDFDKAWHYYKDSGKQAMIFRAKQCHIIGGYYLSLNPGLWSVESYKYLAGKLDVNLNENPEIQFGRYQGKYNVGDVISYPPPIQVNNEEQFHSGKSIDGKLFDIVIEDIGADWLKENNLNKPENKDNFVSYPFEIIKEEKVTITKEQLENGIILPFPDNLTFAIIDKNTTPEELEKIQEEMKNTKLEVKPCEGCSRKKGRPKKVQEPENGK